MYDIKTRITNVMGYKVINIFSKEFRVTSICLSFRIGLVNDTKGKNGICYVIFNYMLFKSGTLYEEFTSLTLDVDLVINREYTTFTVSCEDSNYERVLELMLMMYSDFTYDEYYLEYTKKYVTLKYKLNQDNIDHCLDLLIHEVVFTRQMISKYPIKLKTLETITKDDLEAYYYDNFNNKNIFITISSKNIYKLIIAVIQSVLKKYHFCNGIFNSFKKYRFSSKSKYAYKNSLVCYCNLVYKTNGIREYHNYVYYNVIQKLIEYQLDKILGENVYKFLGIQQILYSRIGLFILRFVVEPEDISIFHNIIEILSSLKISIEVLNHVVNTMLINSKYTFDSSKSVTLSMARHFMYLKKIEKYNFYVGILNSVDYVYIQDLISILFATENVSLCIIGPKINKKIINVFNNVSLNTKSE